ncbi:MAG: hypothetical protein CMG59_06310 [Candidatus Marinimicrobia bacterium]|nr:hypothetical protein [Candidatus Neomarinimicrobiota bacterium]
MSKKILVIAMSDLSKSPRPMRQIEALKDRNIVDTVGVRASGLERNFYKINKSHVIIEILKLPLLLLRMYQIYYWDKYKKNILKTIGKNDYDLIIVHEIRMLPLALKISNRAKIILDAHEYSPENFNDDLIWRIFIKHFYIYLCERFINKCDKIITVCDGIANLYKKNFNVDCEVITNATEHFELEPIKTELNKIKIIHHGNASSSRKLELMIEMMDFLDDRFELYLMLVAKRTNKIYFNKLKKISKGYSNVYFLKPVTYSEIVPYSNQFDIGIQFHPPVNINLQFGLGNKFFEFIQSRLAIAIGPSVEMRKYVEKYDLGIVSESFNPKSMAAKLNSLSSQDIINFKNNSHKNALKLSSNSNKKKFLEIVDRVVE